MKITTWSYKNTHLCALSVRHCFMYLTARFAAVSKRNVHWVTLKHRLNTWTLARFYSVDIGTYRCVFIMLLQERIAAVQNSNIRGLSLKVNALSCPTPNSTPNLPDSVNKCKTDIKTYLLMQPCHFIFLICRFELLCPTVITWTRAPRLLSMSPYSVSYRINLLSMKTHRYEAGYVCVMCERSIVSAFKSPSFLILFWSRNIIFFK